METKAIQEPAKKLSFPIDEAFLAKVMIPYRKDCMYLQSATFEQVADTGVEDWNMVGTFQIQDSCYIDDTGHFNAVEYNICYNQIAYLFLGHCINNQLIPELATYDMNTYYQKQLSNFLIAKIASSYKKPINAKRFYGSFGIHSIVAKKRCVFINTYCHFWDDGDGQSEGEVVLAVLYP